MLHLKVESEIRDLHAKSGLFRDQIGTLVPFGTKSRIRDLIGAPAFIPLKLIFWVISRTDFMGHFDILLFQTPQDLLETALGAGAFWAKTDPFTASVGPEGA